MTLTEVVGGNVRRLRRLQEMSQAELGARLGLSQPTVAQLEAGKRPTTIEDLAAVAAVLGIEPPVLLNGIDIRVELVAGRV